MFDGAFRLYTNGKLIDARNLPAEPKADPQDPAAADARRRLRPLLDGITKDSPAPALTFESRKVPE